MTRPTLRTVLVFTVGIAIAALSVLISGQLWPLWLSYLGVATFITGLDILLALPRHRLQIETRGPHTLYIGDNEDLTIKLSAPHWPRPVHLEILCDLGPSLETQPSQEATLMPGRETLAAIVLAPKRRGKAVVENIWVRWRGPFGMTWQARRDGVNQTIPVVPNIKSVRSAAIRFFSRYTAFGTKVQEQRGEGSEFDALREYVPGLDHRFIDWKHSARHQKLVCKEFRAERNHQIIMAFDTGYLMAEPLEGVPKLDHAINAGLLLSYVSLRSGDRIGLFGFDAQVRLYTAPVAGTKSFQRIQRASSELGYRSHETNFTLGLAELSARLRRRSLVIVFTDFIDTVTAELMVENIQRLAGRHLILFVTLRDQSLFQIIDARPNTVTELARSVVADNLFRERAVVLEKLQKLGVHCLDTAPQRLSAELLNRYLTVRRRELI